MANVIAANYQVEAENVILDITFEATKTHM